MVLGRAKGRLEEWMTRRFTFFASAVIATAGLGYAAVSAQSTPAAGAATVSVFKSPT